MMDDELKHILKSIEETPPSIDKIIDGVMNKIEKKKVEMITDNPFIRKYEPFYLLIGFIVLLGGTPLFFHEIKLSFLKDVSDLTSDLYIIVSRFEIVLISYETSLLIAGVLLFCLAVFILLRINDSIHQ